MGNNFGLDKKTIERMYVGGHGEPTLAAAILSNEAINNKGLIDLDIKGVMDKHFKDLKFDKKLYKKIKYFRIAWGQKSDDYITFLGTNLLGTVIVRFSEDDEQMFFTDIIKVDREMLKEDINKVDGIDPKWNVGANPMYLSLAYMMHRFMTSKDIGNYRDEAIKETYFVLAYKAVGSLISHYFSYTVDPTIAKAVYERLSNRYLIKKLSNWQAVFEYRTKDFLKGGLHYKRLHTFSTDDAVRIAIDAQGRIRETIKNIYVILIEVNENKERIKTSTLKEETDGGEDLKAMTNHSNKIIEILSIVNNRYDFVNHDYVYLVASTMKNLDQNLLIKSLNYISDNYKAKFNDKDDYIGFIITNGVNYLISKNIVNNYEDRVLEILKMLKSYWSSSSVKNPELKEVKKKLMGIVKVSTGKKTKWMLTTTTIGIMTYIFLLSIVRR